MSKSTIYFSVAEAVARDAPELQKSLQTLVRFFGPQVYRIVAQDIQQAPTAERAIWIAEKLSRIERCMGFDLHLREYLNDVVPSLFVSCLAAHLVERAEELELEPAISSHAAKPDMRVRCIDQEVFVECKCPLEDIGSRYLEEHQRIFEMIKPSVPLPYAIEFWYRNSPGREELEAVGERIKNRLGHVSADGTIVNTGNVRVKVQTGVDAFPLGISLWVNLIAPDETTNTSLPGHLIARDGLSMCLYGPIVDYTSILTERIRKSRLKVPPGLPFVVAIASNRMLGSMADNVSAIEKVFQPRKNTRISGVLLAEFMKAAGEGDVISLRLIPNPYSVAPLSSEARRLLTEEAK